MSAMENSEPEKNKALSGDTQVDVGMSLGSGYVTSILGKGGFATVYEIWNPKLEVKRAVKLVNPDIPEQSLGQFETEIKITAKFHHPNIIEIHNVGEWNGRPYIEMEIIDGSSLREIVEKKGALPVEVATAIFILVCRALIYAHGQDIILYGKQRKGVVHCDIKPANIMITNQGIVKLTDFGLATPLDASLHSDNEKFNGTFRYASPEQLKMMPVDERTDIYSLSVAMYEVYTGKRAFHGLELEELVKNRLEDIYIPFELHCPDIHPAIKKIIKKNMAFDRDERTETVHELLADVEKVYSKLSVETPEKIISDFFSDTEMPFTVKRPIGKKRIFFVVTFCTFAVLASISYFLKQRSLESSGATSESVAAATNNTQFSQTLQVTSTGTGNSGTAIAGSHSSKVSEATGGHQETVRPKQPSPEMILDQIGAAIKRKELDKANKLFSAHSMDDGEYYFLYAQYLAATGKDAAALSYVEKGFKTPAKRLSTDQRRVRYMSSKAICLTIAFDRSKVKAQGEKAMEAWFDVKYVLKDQPTDIQYKYADSEIRRIHTILQNTVTH